MLFHFSIFSSFPFISSWIIASLLSACANPNPCNRPPIRQKIRVDAQGQFSPMVCEVCDQDTVEWIFSDRGDHIARLGNTPAQFPDICNQILPFDASDPNEFTGPLPEAPSGVFTLSPDGPGFKILQLRGGNTPCGRKDTAAKSGAQFLCTSGPAYRSMAYTWENPAITGVFIRLRWNQINPAPGQYYWDDLEAEMDQAVANGKLFSIGIKAGSEGTPEWLFDKNIVGTRVLDSLKFKDGGSHMAPGACGKGMKLGNPTDPNYFYFYGEMLQAIASFIKTKNSWYRALAYVKPSGANFHSHENRLPKNCISGCPVCNPEVWANQGQYKPSGLYKFYQKQFQLIADEFPGKSMVYMLIQAGFPLINEQSEWTAPFTSPLPGGTEQTEKIMELGRLDHGRKFIVSHNGIGPRPEDRNPPKPPCPNSGIHPAQPPFSGASSGCPNKWALKEGLLGQLTGFQTNNLQTVSSPALLESTFRNLWENSDGIYLEIYEELAWDAENNHAGILDPASSSPHRLADWADSLHKRRRELFPQIPDPFPLQYEFVFSRTQPGTATEKYFYTNPAKCGESTIKNYGVIHVLPK